MTREELADIIRARTDDLTNHVGRLAAMQTDISGELVAVESNLRDLRGDIAGLLQRIEGGDA